MTVAELEKEMSDVWRQIGLCSGDLSSPRFKELEERFNKLAERRFWLLHMQPIKEYE